MDPNTRNVTLLEWQAEAISLFGEHPSSWTFVCPACGQVQSKNDLFFLPLDADNIVGYACIDRWQTNACRQVGGPVLLTISPDEVRPMFEFYKP